MEKPKIRFKGYQEDWEQRKLDDVAEFSKGSGYSKGDLIESGTPIILYGRLYTKYETIISDVDTFVEARDGSVYSKGGEVIVPASGETAEDIARAASVDKSGILLGGDLNVVMPNEDINSAFLAISISNGSSQRELARKAQGKSVVHIHNEEIRNLIVPFPTKAEQNKIENYFANLDNLITLHHRKYKNLHEMRLNDWEQRKLGDVAQEFKSGNSLKADEIDITGDYPVYGGNGLRGYTSTYNHDGEYALIGRQGALCGNMNYSVGKAYFTEHAVVVKADENNDTRFLYYMLDTMNLGQYSDQSAQPGLAVNKLVKLENRFPTKEEQQRMGWYFSNIDHLITLHHRKYMKYADLSVFDWEQRKFGEIVEKYEDPVETPTEGYTRLGIRSHAKGTFHSYVEKGKELETAKMFRVAADKFIVNITFGWEHAVAITDENDIGKLVSHRFPQYSFNAGMDPKFFRYLILDENFKHHLELSSPGGAGRNRVLKLSDMLQYKMNFPSETEQKKIAVYFDDLDNLITLHQRKCKELQNIKKYMLQNMFV